MTRRPPTIALAFALMIPLQVAPRTWAEPTGASVDDAFSRLKAKGTRCYRERRYRCALDHFERALALRPEEKGMRFNVASAEDKLGLAPRAIRGYRRYLAEAGDDAPARAGAHIARRLPLLLAKVTRLELSTTPTDTRLLVDGKATAPVGKELVLAPGKRRIEVNAHGYQPQTITVEAEAGAALRRQVTLERELSPAERALVARRRSKTIWGIGAGAVAVAGLVTAGVLYGVGLNRGNTAHDDYEAATTDAARARSADDVRAGERMVSAGHVVTGLSLVAAGFSLHQLLTRPAVEPRVALRVGPSSLALRGSF